MILNRLPNCLRAGQNLLSQPPIHVRSMATIRSSMPHVERTAAEPREHRLQQVILSHIQEVNDNVRLLRLSAADPNRAIKATQFLPGQWLDTFIPNLRQAGGFTITSTPAQARPSPSSPPFLELAIQKSKNPPAQWLWRPEGEILGSQLTVRVGGSFTWPPATLDTAKIERLVLIAGGVGINPLISITTHLLRYSPTRPREIHFLYATKTSPDLDPSKILFLPRLQDLVGVENDPKVTLSLFLTGTDYPKSERIEHGRLPNRTFARRICQDDLISAIDGYQSNPSHDNRRTTVAYVCGPPRFTDEFVEFLRGQEGMSEQRVLCEKWW